jgi:hypothetical protein
VSRDLFRRPDLASGAVNPGIGGRVRRCHGYPASMLPAELTGSALVVTKQAPCHSIRAPQCYDIIHKMGRGGGAVQQAHIRSAPLRAALSESSGLPVGDERGAIDRCAS